MEKPLQVGLPGWEGSRGQLVLVISTCGAGEREREVGCRTPSLQASASPLGEL